VCTERTVWRVLWTVRGVDDARCARCVPCTVYGVLRTADDVRHTACDTRGTVYGVRCTREGRGGGGSCVWRHGRLGGGRTSLRTTASGAPFGTPGGGALSGAGAQRVRGTVYSVALAPWCTVRGVPFTVYCVPRTVYCVLRAVYRGLGTTVCTVYGGRRTAYGVLRTATHNNVY
jgi:hypothetical protein